jgi:hypothetical protein
VYVIAVFDCLIAYEHRNEHPYNAFYGKVGPSWVRLTAGVQTRLLGFGIVLTKYLTAVKASYTLKLKASHENLDLVILTAVDFKL